MGDRAKELISRGGNYHKNVIEAGKWKEAIRGYLASITFADAMVGKLLENLKMSKYAENTIIVIWSDHGWQLGEKMHWRKFALWENVIKTLLMIKVPEGITVLPSGSNNGKNVESLTSLLDIYPTLVELCDLPQNNNLDGKSLVKLLENPERKIDRSIITTYDFADYSVRKGPWHYINYVDGSEELYNLENDNEEWYNLIGQGSYENIVGELRSHIPINPIKIPEKSLIPLLEHHIPPVTSREFYFSEERINWLKRFNN